MSDNKNEIDTDFEEKLAEIVGKKSRKRTNNNIYERFINRVENGDEDYDDSLDIEGVQQSKSTEDSFDFLDQEMSVEEDIESTYKSDESNHYLESDSEDHTFAHDSQDAHNIDNDDRLITQNSSIESVAGKAAPAQHKLASSKKPLIIGMLLGSLLIVIVVALLIFTGVLSPSAQSHLSDAADTSTNSEVEAQAATDVSTAPIAVDTLPSTDLNSTNPPVITPQQARPTNDNQEVTANNVAQAPTAALDTVSNTEPAITYEDFREESQNTVYRETDD